MTNADWNQAVKGFLSARFSGAPRAVAYYGALWDEHHAEGLEGHHFVTEFTSRSEEKFRQRLWEMALGRHLHACGHQITTRPEGEPDYRFQAGDRTVWVEAISPSPGPDLPRDWTTFDPSNPGPSCGSVPNREMLLRWTSAFKAKAEKCSDYRAKGIVRPSDAFVIAIDGSQLSKFAATHGISQTPFVVETVFAIGPLAIEIDQATRKLGHAFQTVEAAVENRNKAPVPKERFFRPEYSGVSAVLGCYPTVYADAMLPVQVAYNPLAKAPIAPGNLGRSAEEWIAEFVVEDADGQNWIVQRLPERRAEGERTTST